MEQEEEFFTAICYECETELSSEDEENICDSCQFTYCEDCFHDDLKYCLDCVNEFNI